jgi:hypothetical protein
VVPAPPADHTKECGQEEARERSQRQPLARQKVTTKTKCEPKPASASGLTASNAPPASRNTLSGSPAFRADDRAPPTERESRVFKSAPYRIDWATLLHRVYDVDALACPCGGRLRFLDLVTDEPTVREILARLGLPSDAPTLLSAAVSRADALDDLPPPDW